MIFDIMSGGVGDIVQKHSTADYTTKVGPFYDSAIKSNAEIMYVPSLIE